MFLLSEGGHVAGGSGLGDGSGGLGEDDLNVAGVAHVGCGGEMKNSQQQQKWHKLKKEKKGFVRPMRPWAR